MADRIEINFTANVREVTRGTDQISDSLKDTERDLTDLGKSGEQSLEKITDAQQETSDGAKDLGTSVGGDLVGAFDKLDGTAAGTIDAIASGLAGIGSAVAPAAGAAIGVLATEGIGLLTSQIRDAQAEVDELKARFASLYQSAAEDGRTYLAEAQIQSEVLAVTFDDDRTRYNQAKSDAATLGLTVQEVIRAQVGDSEALNTVLERSAALEGERRDITKDYLNLRLGPEQQANLAATSAAEEIANRYSTISDVQRENQRLADEYLVAQQATNEEIQIRNRTLAETPKEVPVKLTVDDSALTNSLARSRTLRLSIEGYAARGGARVI